MRLLLDTHILVWALTGSSKLGGAARSMIEDGANTVLFSVASIWEIAIKSALCKPDLRYDPAQLLAEALLVGFEECAITSTLALAASKLPLHHRDPFDRMLVAQALGEPAQLLTADKMLTRYPGFILLAI